MANDGFKLSIITAVYNCADYLEEMVSSLYNQTIGFDNLEIILIDDGSTDDSLTICRDMKKKYPYNVQVAAKKNGGVSSARNVGLEIATGEYINFLDADDKLSENCLKSAVETLDANPDVDIASFAIMFFGGRDDEHNLNWKYSNATRIADLDTEPEIVQMSSSSAVFRRSAWGDLRFDETLRYAEDAKAIQQFLFKNRKIALISKDDVYYYRRREGSELSAIQNSSDNPEWYVPYMEKFQVFVMGMRENDGTLPAFLKYVLMHDLQYHIKDSKAEKVLAEKEAAHYKELIVNVLQEIDDEIILAQRRLYYRHKLLVLKLKYNGKYDLIEKDGKFFARFGNTEYQLNRPNLKNVNITETDSDFIVTGILERIFDAPFGLCAIDRGSGTSISEHITKEGATNQGKVEDTDKDSDTVIKLSEAKDKINMLGVLYSEFYDLCVRIPKSSIGRELKLGLQLIHEGMTQNVKMFFTDELLEHNISKKGIKYGSYIVIGYEQTILFSRGGIKALVKHYLS